MLLIDAMKQPDQPTREVELDCGTSTAVLQCRPVNWTNDVRLMLNAARLVRTQSSCLLLHPLPIPTRNLRLVIEGP